MDYNKIKVGMMVSTDTGRIGRVLPYTTRKIVLKMEHSTLSFTRNKGVSLEEFYKEVSEVKTSDQWNKEDDSGVIIMDPDGWDRSNYEYSYYEELITEEEYYRRKMFSTCLFNNTDSNGKIV